MLKFYLSSGSQFKRKMHKKPLLSKASNKDKDFATRLECILRELLMSSRSKFKASNKMQFTNSRFNVVKAKKQSQKIVRKRRTIKKIKMIKNQIKNKKMKKSSKMIKNRKTIRKRRRKMNSDYSIK
jgi:hypothetical protein